MNKFTRLLQKQIKKTFGENPPTDERFAQFLQLIDDTYQHYESDRTLLERAMEISSDELMEANRDLRKERGNLKSAVSSIEESIKVLAESNSDIEEHKNVDLFSDSSEIRDLANRLKNMAETQVESAKQLRAQELRMEEAQQLANFGNWQYDVETKETVWSPQMYHIYDIGQGTKPPDFHQYIEFVHPEDREVVKVAMEELSSKRVLTTDIRVLVGKKLKWIRTTTKLKFDEKLQREIIVGTAIDITLQKRAEVELAQKLDELQEANNFLDSLFENLPLLLFVKDAETRKYLVNNNAGAEMAGIQDPNIIGKTVWEIFPEHLAKIYDEQDNKVIASGQMLIDPVEPLFLLDGTKKYLHTKKVPIRNAQGKIKYLLTISEDVTERIEAEEQIKHAAIAAEEANRAKSAFLSSMSHELRTPLNAIIGFSQILRRDEALPVQQRSYVETMYRSGNHLLDMINDVLDISKIESGRFELLLEGFNLREVLRDVHAMFRLKAQEKNLTLKLSVSENVPELVYSDAKRIQQVLINLVGNAVKFTEKGEVSFSIEAENLVGTSSKMIEFRVSDSGRGIPSDQLQTIFEPFRQVKGIFNEGTGLGLAISLRIAELLDGSINVDSEFGKGSTFTFSIPVQPSEIETTDADDDYIPVDGIVGDKKYRILVVDDIPSNRAVIRTLLQLIGFEVVEAENGRDAIVMAKMLQPDLIFMDIMMPIMDGIRSFFGVRADSETKHIPIIALTASGSKQRRHELIKTGFDDYVAKPFREKWIIDVLQKHLHLEFRHKLKQDTGQFQNSQNLDIGSLARWALRLPSSKAKLFADMALTNDLQGIEEWAKNLESSPETDYVLKMAHEQNHLFFIELSDKIELEEK